MSAMFAFYQKSNNIVRIANYKFTSPPSGWKKEEADNLAFSL